MNIIFMQWYYQVHSQKMSVCILENYYFGNKKSNRIFLSLPHFRWLYLCFYFLTGLLSSIKEDRFVHSPVWESCCLCITLVLPARQNSGQYLLKKLAWFVTSDLCCFYTRALPLVTTERVSWKKFFRPWKSTGQEIKTSFSIWEILDLSF